MDKEIPTTKMKKARCPFCGTPVNAFYKDGAACRGVFFRCKNPACRKQFELRL